MSGFGLILPLPLRWVNQLLFLCFELVDPVQVVDWDFYAFLDLESSVRADISVVVIVLLLLGPILLL